MIFSRIKEEDGYSKEQVRRHNLLRKAFISAIVLGLTLVPMAVAAYFRINNDERGQIVLIPTMAVFYISLLYAYWQLRKAASGSSDADDKEKSDDGQASEKCKARFTKKELVDFAELEKDMEGYMDKLSKGELEKIGAIRDDKLEVVMMHIDEYEKWWRYVGCLERSRGQ